MLTTLIKSIGTDDIEQVKRALFTRPLPEEYKTLSRDSNETVPLSGDFYGLFNRGRIGDCAGRWLSNLSDDYVALECIPRKGDRKKRLLQKYLKTAKELQGQKYTTYPFGLEMDTVRYKAAFHRYGTAVREAIGNSVVIDYGCGRPDICMIRSAFQALGANGYIGADPKQVKKEHVRIDEFPSIGRGFVSCYFRISGLEVLSRIREMPKICLFLSGIESRYGSKDFSCQAASLKELSDGRFGNVSIVFAEDLSYESFAPVISDSFKLSAQFDDTKIYRRNEDGQ